jgi:phage gp46-like protein
MESRLPGADGTSMLAVLQERLGLKVVSEECTTHEGERLSVWCDTCGGLPVCSQCSLLYHNKHMLTPLSEAAETARSEIRRMWRTDGADAVCVRRQHLLYSELDTLSVNITAALDVRKNELLLRNGVSLFHTRLALCRQ